MFRVTLSSQHLTKQTWVNTEQKAYSILTQWYSNMPGYGKVEVYDGVVWIKIADVGVLR